MNENEMTDHAGHCVIKETMRVAREHGMKDEEMHLIYAPEQKKEICYKCKNILC